MNILKNKRRPFIGQKIFKLRQENHLTQIELCNLLGVTRRTITYYELEAKNITLDFAQKLAKVFKVDSNIFLNGKTNIQTRQKKINPLPKKLRRFSELSKEDQRYMSKMIETLADKHRQK